MATITQRTCGWQVQIRRKGHPPLSKHFETRHEARQWARLIESEMDRGVFVDRSEAEQTTLGDVLQRYGRLCCSLETAMRRGELVRMRWEQVNVAKRVLRIPDTKNGESRDIPLSSRALEILDELPRRIDGKVFGLTANSISQAFERASERAGISNLRFHDLRHEATSRFFERGLNPMQVASITGHKTLQMLKRYTHLRAEDLAKLLA